MTLDLHWIEDAEKRPRQRQLPMPWQPVCCSDAAVMAGWSWHRMARAIRRHFAMPPAASMRKVRVSADQVAEISANRAI